MMRLPGDLGVEQVKVAIEPIRREVQIVNCASKMFRCFQLGDLASLRMGDVRSSHVCGKLWRLIQKLATDRQRKSSRRNRRRLHDGCRGLTVSQEFVEYSIQL